MLEVEKLRVAYGEKLILSEISLYVPSGQILGVIGPNGVGKTTLVRAISGVIPLAGGRVSVDGQDLARLKPAERARSLAVVPQARNLPPAFTGWELVLLGRTPHLNWLGQVSRHDEARVRDALVRAHAEKFADRRIGELSGGEQQRLLLARALAQEAPVLLLDEPTTHLDLQHQVTMLEEVRRLAHEEGLTVLAVLHDLNLVSRYADRVALMVEGRVRAAGSAEEVLNPSLLEEVYHLPLQVITNTPSGKPVILPGGL